MLLPLALLLSTAALPAPAPPASVPAVDDVAERLRALEHVDADQLIVSSDCGFGRQGCNRDIAFFKTAAIAQGCNIVRKELGIEASTVPAADPALQTDIVPKVPDR